MLSFAELFLTTVLNVDGGLSWRETIRLCGAKDEISVFGGSARQLICKTWA